MTNVVMEKVKADNSINNGLEYNYSEYEIIKCSYYNNENNSVIKLDEQGMAELLCEKYHNEIKYNKALKSWLLYKDGCWIKDEKDEIYGYIKKIQQELNKVAFQTEDKKYQKRIYKYIKSTRNSMRQKNIIFLSEKEKQIACAPNDFDNHKYLFNVKNGTIDLLTGELLPHDSKNMLTKKSEVYYDPKVEPIKWLKYLDEIFLGNQELIDFLQKYLGLILSGNTDEHIFPIFFGGGANGKSVLINTIRCVMGDYMVETPASSLMIKRGSSSVSNDIARLKGIRFVVAQESNDGSRLDEEKIKMMTGGDKQVARFLYGEYFEFMSEFKIVLVTNHKPGIKGGDYGIWRRVLLIPFDYTVDANKKDNKMTEKLSQESSGILNWMIEGFNKWKNEGLEISETIRAVTNEYKKEEDTMGNFFEECIDTEPESKIMASSLYTLYKEWCQKTGEYATNNKLFSKRVEEKGYKKKRIDKGLLWLGINKKLDLNLDDDYSYDVPLPYSE